MKETFDIRKQVKHNKVWQVAITKKFLLKCHNLSYDVVKRSKACVGNVARLISFLFLRSLPATGCQIV